RRQLIRPPLDRSNATWRAARIALTGANVSAPASASMTGAFKNLYAMMSFSPGGRFCRSIRGNLSIASAPPPGIPTIGQSINPVLSVWVGRGVGEVRHDSKRRDLRSRPGGRVRQRPKLQLG